MPKSTRFLALLRGINVGGKNIIAKDDLRGCFEDLGFDNVRTYIQSGNILFRSELTSTKVLTAQIEAALSRRFAYDAQAVVLSHRKYKSAVAARPQGWGEGKDTKHHAAFTMAGLTPAKAIAQLPPPKPDIETVTPAPGVIYWLVATASLGKSTLAKLPQHPVYQQMTLRNHNTVLRLLEMFEEG